MMLTCGPSTPSPGSLKTGRALRKKLSLSKLMTVVGQTSRYRTGNLQTAVVAASGNFSVIEGDRRVGFTRRRRCWSGVTGGRMVRREARTELTDLAGMGRVYTLAIVLCQQGDWGVITACGRYLFAL